MILNKTFITFIMCGAAVFFALAALTGGASFAGETPHEPVWEQYLSPADRAALTEMKNLPAAPPPPEDATPEDIVSGAREGFNGIIRAFAQPLAGQTTERHSAGGVNGLWIRPGGAGKDKVLLYLHGGGFVVGSAESGAGIAGYLAAEAGITAFSLDYPLAPEAAYPAQLDSAQAAYQMLLAGGVAPERIVVAGDSAGGNLTLALLLRLRERGLPLPAGAYLISPWADLTHTSATHTSKKAADFTLSREMLEWMAGCYAPGRERTDPFVSPVKADLRGLPPMLIQVGSFEILLDDSLTIAKNAADADVPARLSVWPGYGHDFQMFFSRLEGAQAALAEAAAFLTRTLDGRLLRSK